MVWKLSTLTQLLLACINAWDEDRQDVVVAERDLQSAGYNLEVFGDLPELQLAWSMCTWVDFVATDSANYRWWNADNNSELLRKMKEVQSTFNRRLARIVYALFDTDTIWSVFDEYLQSFLEEKLSSCKIEAKLWILH